MVLPVCLACRKTINIHSEIVRAGMKTCAECGATFHKNCSSQHAHTNTGTGRDHALQASVGKDAKQIVGVHGERQSYHTFRLDMFPRALLHVAHVCHQGNIDHEPEGHVMLDTMEPIEPNWHKIPSRDHWNRCMVHVQAYMAGDRSDDHLGHAACRALFALEVHLLEKENDDVANTPR